MCLAVFLKMEASISRTKSVRCRSRISLKLAAYRDSERSERIVGDWESEGKKLSSSSTWPVNRSLKDEGRYRRTTRGQVGDHSTMKSSLSCIRRGTLSCQRCLLEETRVSFLEQREADGCAIRMAAAGVAKEEMIFGLHSGHQN